MPAKRLPSIDAGRARGDGLRDVAGIANTAVGDQRNARSPTPSKRASIAEICGTPTPATMRVVQIEPGPMPTLIAVGAAVGQRPRAARGRDVAADHLHFREGALDPANALEHALRMAVRGIDHQDVDAGRDQRLGALVGVATGSDRRADAQLTELVLAGVRVLGRLQDVLDRDETLELELVVHNENTLEPVAMHEALGVLELGALGHGDQLVALGHDIGHRLIEIGLETQVAVGHDADDLAPVEHRQPGDLVRLASVPARRARTWWAGTVIGSLTTPLSKRLTLATSAAWAFRGMFLCTMPIPPSWAMAMARRASVTGVHCRRQQRNVQRNARGKAGLEADVAGNDSGVGREQQDVVKSEGF